jgi:hypothetical protein
MDKGRQIAASGGRKLRATPVFDTYWRFASERQRVFMKRCAGDAAPWTDDEIIGAHRFTNVYRASDRVSQYLISHVIYEGSQAVDEVFFRTLLFKIFNRIDTWEYLCEQVGVPSCGRFNIDEYARCMDVAMNAKRKLYSAAYIMPSPAFGNARKHRNHLELLAKMLKEGLPAKVAKAASLREVFELLVAQPSLGDFLAFQFAIDLNYSEIVNFSEMDFVVAGPGARDGISKCFSETDDLTEAEIIEVVAKIADSEFERLKLPFHKLGGTRALQLIDCQNVFCELSKYARVKHPEVAGLSGRTRIKQKYIADHTPLPQRYPDKWQLSLAPTPTRPKGVAVAPRGGTQPKGSVQQSFGFVTTRT